MKLTITLLLALVVAGKAQSGIVQQPIGTIPQINSERCHSGDEQGNPRNRWKCVDYGLWEDGPRSTTSEACHIFMRGGGDPIMSPDCNYQLLPPSAAHSVPATYPDRVDPVPQFATPVIYIFGGTNDASPEAIAKASGLLFMGSYVWTIPPAKHHSTAPRAHQSYRRTINPTQHKPRRHQ